MSVNRVFEGFTVVAMGVILLLNTTGALPWSVWLHVLSLWPLLLVGAGLEIIGKALDAVWLRVFSSVLVLGGLLFGALVLPAMGDTPALGRFVGGSGEPFSVTVPFERGVRTGEVSVKGGVGSHTITAGDELVSVTGRSPHGEPRVETDVRAGAATVDILGPEAERVWIPGVRGGTDMNIALARDVAWDMTLDAGVVDVDADLSDLTVTGLAINSGVSQVTVRLGEVGRGVREVPVRIKGGVANFTIRLPAGAGVRVEGDAGITNVDVDRSIPRVSGERRWENDEFRSSGGYLIRLETGISNVRIETY